MMLMMVMLTNDVLGTMTIMMMMMITVTVANPTLSDPTTINP